MPAAWTAKDERQYGHILRSCKKRGRYGVSRCKSIAAATVNKQRRREGRTLGDLGESWVCNTCRLTTAAGPSDQRLQRGRGATARVSCETLIESLRRQRGWSGVARETGLTTAAVMQAFIETSSMRKRGLRARCADQYGEEARRITGYKPRTDLSGLGQMRPRWGRMFRPPWCPYRGLGELGSQRLGRLRFRDVSRRLRKQYGCEHVRTSGSHQIWSCPGGCKVSLPAGRKDVAYGVVQGIERQLKPCFGRRALTLDDLDQMRSTVPLAFAAAGGVLLLSLVGKVREAQAQEAP